MFRIRLVPADTRIAFMGWRRIFYALSLVAALLSVTLLVTRGLNFGIDFVGGIMIEAETPATVSIGDLRRTMGGLGLGEVAIQEFGAENDFLIRIARQPGDAAAQQAAVSRVQDALREAFGPGIDYRRIEVVGPKVSGELVEAGATAVVIAIAAMLIYIWFRFEWQFGVGAVIALTHDVTLTLGVFSAMALEFNLSIIAALLAIVGYSMNDTVVVYDRVRENLRKYKSLDLESLLDLSINETLARTTMTSFTTLLALGALYTFGGEVIRGFTFAMIWGILVGTYSSIFVAAPLLIMMKLRREPAGEASETARA